jgi:hypothetical protein
VQTYRATIRVCKTRRSLRGYFAQGLRWLAEIEIDEAEVDVRCRLKRQERLRDKPKRVNTVLECPVVIALNPLETDQRSHRSMSTASIFGLEQSFNPFISALDTVFSSLNSTV